MAEENLAPVEGAEEQIVAPEEQVSAAPITIEDFARERGWKPKEEFEGAETDWRDAQTFVSFGMDRNKDIMRDLREMRETTASMARTQAQITEQAVERARTEERERWEQRHAEAVEQGDLTTATQAVSKIAELSVKPVRPADPGLDGFRRENGWFDSDRAARAMAIEVAQSIADQGGTAAEQFKAARDAVHKRFPEYAPAQTKPAPSLARPGDRVVDTRNRKKGFNDLPKDAQDACRALVAKKLTSQEGYVANYFNQGAA